MEARSNIYAVGYGGYVKIGLSREVKARIQTLQTGSPERLVQYAAVPVPVSLARRAEALAHHALSAKRAEGEWFSVAPEEAAAAIAKAAEDAANGIEPPGRMAPYRARWASPYEEALEYCTTGSLAARSPEEIGLADFYDRYPEQAPPSRAGADSREDGSL